MGSDAEARVERPVAKAPIREIDEDFPDAAPAAGSERRTRGYARPLAAQIECPICETFLEAQGSALRSVRCEGCGHLLTFEEVMALREREHARMSRYL